LGFLLQPETAVKATKARAAVNKAIRSFKRDLLFQQIKSVFPAIRLRVAALAAVPFERRSNHSSLRQNND
jgi:hypothetical protein